MVNELVKMTSGPVAVLGDVMNIISGTILECKREDAKTERLEIKAKVYMFEKIEETKRVLARLENENNRGKRIHEEKITELNNKLIMSYQEYNLKMYSLAIQMENIEKRMEILNNQLREINKIQERFMNIFEKETQNKLVYEYLKVVIDNKTKMLSSLINVNSSINDLIGL